jgi:hypothetical protein
LLARSFERSSRRRLRESSGFFYFVVVAMTWREGELRDAKVTNGRPRDALDFSAAVWTPDDVVVRDGDGHCTLFRMADN